MKKKEKPATESSKSEAAMKKVTVEVPKPLRVLEGQSISTGSEVNPPEPLCGEDVRGTTTQSVAGKGRTIRLSRLR